MALELGGGEGQEGTELGRWDKVLDRDVGEGESQRWLGEGTHVSQGVMAMSSLCHCH